MKNKTRAYLTLLPYCLERRGADGAFVAMNRDYKPLGFLTGEWVRYEAYPIGFRFARLTPETIRALSWNGSDNENAIYLYADHCAPFFTTEENTRAYLDRLERLGRLAVLAEPVPLPSDEDALRERLRKALEGIQGGWWRNKFPEVEAMLRNILRWLEDSTGKKNAPLMVDLFARELTPPELSALLKEVRLLVRAVWPHRWNPLYENLERAEKAVELAVCD